jgi:adenylate cyclase
MDAVRVVGRTEAVIIYELVNRYANLVSPERMDFIRYYEEGLSNYRKREWKKAQEFFEKAEVKIEKDHSCRIMALRCREYMINPPPEDWDGVYTAVSK